MLLFLTHAIWVELIGMVGNTAAERYFRDFGVIHNALPIALATFANHLLQESRESCYSAHLIWAAIYAYRRALVMDRVPRYIRLKCLHGLARAASEPANWWGGSSPEFLLQLRSDTFAPYELGDVEMMKEVEESLPEAAHDTQIPQFEDEGFRLLRARLNIDRSRAGKTDGVDNAAIGFWNKAGAMPESFGTFMLAINGVAVQAHILNRCQRDIELGTG